MDSPVAETDQRPAARRKWAVVVVVVFALIAVAGLVAAWIMARRPPVQRAETLDQIESVSAGYNFLVAGALPWLVQWAALAVLTGAVARAWYRVNWGAVLLGALFPLVIGLVWWIGLAAMFWKTDPLKAIAELILWDMSRGLGTESIGQFLLGEIFGPLCCPLLLAGPVSMQGWDFLWAGVSTGLIISTLTYVVRRTEVDLAEGQKFNLEQFLLVTGWALVYLAPVYIRALQRVSASS